MSRRMFTLAGGLAATAAIASLYYFKKSSSTNCSGLRWPCTVSCHSLGGLFSSGKPDVAALNPEDFRAFKVLKNERVSHNTRRIRLDLPEDSDVFGLTLASCVVTRITDPATGKVLVRPYTPVTTESEAKKHRYVEFVIKGYDDGKVSTHMTQLKEGDVVELKGPFVKLDFTSDRAVINRKHIGMIAGGTGITPMLQVLHELLKDDPNAPLTKHYKDTRFTLLFANREPQDILCKPYLDSLVQRYPGRFNVHYVVDESPHIGDAQLQREGITVGRIDKKMVEEKLSGPSDKSSMVLVCGPESLLTHFAGPKNADKSQGPLAGVLKELGYSQDQIFKF